MFKSFLTLTARKNFVFIPWFKGEIVYLMLNEKAMIVLVFVPWFRKQKPSLVL